MELKTNTLYNKPASTEEDKLSITTVAYYRASTVTKFKHNNNDN